MGTNTVTFFGLTFDLDPIAFTLPIGNGWSVYWYGIMIALGFLLAFIYGLKKAPKLGINTDRLLDGIIITVPLAVLGARAYYMFFYSPETFFSDFLKIHDGGLAIYGGIIGAFIGIVISCKTRKIPFLDCPAGPVCRPGPDPHRLRRFRCPCSRGARRHRGGGGYL